MKKFIRRISVGIVMLVISIFLITTSDAAFTMSMNLSGSKKIKLNEEVAFTIGMTEKIVACNFEISYNKDVFELIGSGTTGLSVAVNGNKVSCIYYDAALTGTNELKIKFKAIKETNSASNFSISGAKFRVQGKETSYTGSEIVGADEILTVTSVSKEEPADKEDPDGTDKKDDEIGKDNKNEIKKEENTSMGSGVTGSRNKFSCKSCK